MEDPRIISALFIFLKMAYYNVLINTNFDEANENELRSEENIEENIFRQELIVEINKIIENLPEKFRVPLILYYLFEQPIGEIAKEIKKPPGTVKSRLFKGRSLIKKRLEELGYGK